MWQYYHIKDDMTSSWCSHFCWYVTAQCFLFTNLVNNQLTGLFDVFKQLIILCLQLLFLLWAYIKTILFQFHFFKLLWTTTDAREITIVIKRGKISMDKNVHRRKGRCVIMKHYWIEFFVATQRIHVSFRPCSLQWLMRAITGTEASLTT